MKRLALLLLIALPLLAAPDKWYESYKRGVAAVNAKNYKAAEAALREAITESPAEGVGVRTRNEIVTYVPHFWMGIAKFNLGDVDAALREFRISEEQGAIARTEYYSVMKEWVARAQAEKKRLAQNASAGAKQTASTAINSAIAAQSSAVSAGGDHTESYRAASRKLQEALGAFGRAGTDIDAYQRVVESAKQASALFNAAADEAKKQKAARAAMPKPKPAAPAPVVVQQPVQQPPPKIEPKVEPKPEPPPVPVVTAAETNARVAVQQYRRNLIDATSTKPRDREFQSFLRREKKGADELQRQLEDAKNDADFQRIANVAANGEQRLAKRIEEAKAPLVAAAIVTPTTIAIKPSEELRGTRGTEELKQAYREFAMGNLASSEDLLTRLLDAQPSGEAFLLRGCARYTRAMLSRESDALLAAASDDFKAALQQNRSLRLDERAFSPKLVAFFEKVRNGS